MALDVLIVIERSSAHPVEYAIMLLVEHDGRVRIRRTWRNTLLKHQVICYICVYESCVEPYGVDGAGVRRVAWRERV